MFTGLVEKLGTVRAVRNKPEGSELQLEAAFEALVLGESIAVDGVCLTVTRILDGGFTADASAETLSKTTLGAVRPGRVVHLERALRLGDRLGGHLVSGHVDGVGQLVEKVAVGDAQKVTFEVPPALAPFLAPKGSVCVDGTSLTVNGVQNTRFDVVLVPYTQTATHLVGKAPGTPVNIEVDVLAKYVARLLGRPGVDGGDSGGGVTLDLLQRHGYA